MDCNGDASGGDDCQAYHSAIYDFSVSAGSTYYIRIGGWEGASGQGTMHLTFE